MKRNIQDLKDKGKLSSIGKCSMITITIRLDFFTYDVLDALSKISED